MLPLPLPLAPPLPPPLPPPPPRHCCRRRQQRKQEQTAWLMTETRCEGVLGLTLMGVTRELVQKTRTVSLQRPQLQLRSQLFWQYLRQWQPPPPPPLLLQLRYGRARRQRSLLLRRQSVQTPPAPKQDWLRTFAGRPHAAREAFAGARCAQQRQQWLETA